MKKIISAAVLLSAAIAAPAQNAQREDAKINAVYEGLAKIGLDRDASRLPTVIAPEAVMVGPVAAPSTTGADLAAHMGPAWQKMAADGVTFDTAFRVERRVVHGDVALDSGMMRLKLSRAGMPPKISYQQGLLTMRRQPDGSWRIIGDASMAATEAAWNAVPKKPGLKFDE